MDVCGHLGRDAEVSAPHRLVVVEGVIVEGFGTLIPSGEGNLKSVKSVKQRESALKQRKTA